MERFCFSVLDKKISGILLDMIRGSGAFRRFKDFIYQYDIEKGWYKFWDEAYKEIAITWLKSKGLVWTDDLNRRSQAVNQVSLHFVSD